MGWFKKLKKKVKDVAKDPFKELKSDLESGLEPLLEDVDVDALVDFEDPEAGFDALVDAGKNVKDATKDLDIGKVFEIADKVKEENPDVSLEDLADPRVAFDVAHDLNMIGNDVVLDATGNTKENWQKALGDDLGAYMYNTQWTAGNITPTSESDFQHGGSKELAGPDGDIISLNEEIDNALGGSGEATKEAAQTQIDFSRKALGLLRDDLAPFKDILSDKQIADLGNLATRQDAQTAFLDDNALLDQIRKDVTGASFRGDQGESLDILDLAAPSQGGQPTNRRTGGIKGEKSPQEVFNSSGKNTNIPTGASTQDIISKVFLGAGNDLINQQINRQLPMLNTAQNSAAQVATGSTNLLTGAGNSAAAGTIGAANQKAGNTQNLIGLIATLFSDEDLKKNKKKIGEHKGLDVYTWDWNKEAEKELGLKGSDFGHMAQDVKKKHPDLVSKHNGYHVLNYGDNRTVK